MSQTWCITADSLRHLMSERAQLRSVSGHSVVTEMPIGDPFQFDSFIRNTTPVLPAHVTMSLSATASNLALLALLPFTACNRDHTQPRAQSTMPTSSNSRDAAVPQVELELELDTTYKLTMGWGLVWEGKIRRVVYGQLPDATIALSTYDDPVAYEGHLTCCAPETGLIVRFTRLPEHPATLSGFVAKDGTIWEIVDVKR